MTSTLKQITLRHVLVENKKFIGLQFYPNKVINALTKELTDISWSNEYDLFLLPNCAKNLNTIFNTYR